MKWEKILVRYGELSTKGKNKKQFITHLKNNIKFSFNDIPNVKVNAERDRMFLQQQMMRKCNNWLNVYRKFLVSSRLAQWLLVRRI